MYSKKKGGFEGTFWPFPRRFFCFFLPFLRFFGGGAFLGICVQALRCETDE